MVWVPGVRSRAFVSKVHRQSVAVARSRHAGEDQAFIDAIWRLRQRHPVGKHRAPLHRHEREI